MYNFVNFRTIRSLRNTLDTVEKYLRSLELLGENVAHNSLLCTMYEKFPREIILKIEGKNDNSDMSLLRTELEKEILARERVEHFVGASFPNTKFQNVRQPFNNEAR